MKSELLAPAGNLECLKVAVRSGADAVYVGLNNFNARGNISNFSKEDLTEGVRFAHLFGVKVYLTLNILVADEEIEDVLNLVRFARNVHIDAFIVQDIGFAHLLISHFPDIELHASTQMGICNYEGALFLKEQGFSRVVLARETSLSEIKRIKENLDIEIEYFIQGALCVGYSGNCYFSALEENASGNRGKCKQLCRLPFIMEYQGQKRKGYLLSTKDLCMLSSLKQLSLAGVTSFKIEGRARREAYVAGAVQIYREVIDNNFTFNKSHIDSLKRLFNRGDYANGYLKGEKIIYPQLNSHIGVEIGKVKSFKRGNKFNEIVLSSSHDIVRGDVLQFVGKSVQSVSVYDVKKLTENTFYITTTNVIQPDSVVRLLVDKEYESKIVNKEKTLQVDCCFKGKIGKRAILKLSCKSVTIQIESDFICEEGKTSLLDECECKKQIAKMGENFTLGTFEFDSERIFIPKSQLNDLRRKALERLQEEMIKHFEKELTKENMANSTKNCQKIAKNTKKILIFNNLNDISNAKTDDYLVYNPQDYDKDEIISLCKRMNQMIFLETPVFAENQDIQFLKELLASVDNLGIVANNYYALTLTDPDKIIIGSELNVYNSYSIEFYKGLGFNKIILSKENVLNLNNREGVFVNSLKENLIYFKHCPIKEHIGGNCGNCKFRQGVTYSLGRKKFDLKRKKITNCIFYLKSQAKTLRDIKGYGLVQEVE